MDAKGASPSLAPAAAGSTYSKYASPAAIGRRLAAGPFSSLLLAGFRAPSGRTSSVYEDADRARPDVYLIPDRELQLAVPLLAHLRLAEPAAVGALRVGARAWARRARA